MAFKINNEKWSSITGDDDIGRTMAELLISVDDIKLTENYNTWSKTVDETVLVSSFPLAMWFLQSWWRLLYEPLQAYAAKSEMNIEWRLAHELGSANSGFVWPKVAFISDLEYINIVAKATKDQGQSVRYINGIDGVKRVSMASFEESIGAFVAETIERLNSLQPGSNSLKELWEIIQEETNDPEQKSYRKIEAIMGYDPDEADVNIMKYAMEKYDSIGHSSLEELASSYSRFSKNSLLKIDEFITTAGIFGKPELKLSQIQANVLDKSMPWKQAIKDAQEIRKNIDNEKDPIETKQLYELLGISSVDQTKWGNISDKHNVSIGIPESGNKSIKFIPRKKHYCGQRFELVRYFSDYLTVQDEQWLVCTDMRTSRQKYQRAFAAEFLCPLDGLLEYLQDDFSKDNFEDAADYFEVSSRTVESILANNGYFPIMNNQYIEYPFY